MFTHRLIHEVLTREHFDCIIKIYYFLRLLYFLLVLNSLQINITRHSVISVYFANVVMKNRTQILKLYVIIFISFTVLTESHLILP